MVTDTEVWNVLFRTSKPLWKIWKYKINTSYILYKTTVLDNLVVLKTHTYVQLISNYKYSCLKIRSFLFLWKGFTCLIDKSHYEKTEPFLHKVTFPLRFISLKNIQQWVNSGTKMLNVQLLIFLVKS